MAILNDLVQFRLSGGASNTDALASLGGIRSSHRVLSQQATGLSNITGVTINYAFGNDEGSGTLTHYLPIDGKQVSEYESTREEAGTVQPLCRINGFNITSTSGDTNLVTALQNLADAINANSDVNSDVVAGTATGTDSVATMNITALAANTAFTIDKYNGIYCDNDTGGPSSCIFTELVPPSPPIANKSLGWQSPNDTEGTKVEITGDGDYELESNTNGTLIVTVTQASLPSTEENDTLTVANYENETLPDITGLEGYEGNTDYVCLYVYNTDATTRNITLWIESQPTGNSTIEIGLDPAGVGDGSTTGVATTIANKDTAPSGVTFSAPATEGAGLTTNSVAQNNGFGFWIKRTIAAGERAETDSNYSIGISAI